MPKPFDSLFLYVYSPVLCFASFVQVGVVLPFKSSFLCVYSQVLCFASFVHAGSVVYFQFPSNNLSEEVSLKGVIFLVSF